jgi:hypothetical protein
MPVESRILNLHSQIPGEVSGYELSPVTGLFSIVSPTGIVTNLNDLGLRVLAYMGAGMPPVENVTTPFGVLGGSYVQRTVVRPRPITLTCIVEGRALGQIQRIKSALIAQVAPYNSLNSAKAVKLRYQLTNLCGDLIGTTLEVPVLYTGDLTGQTTNLYQDRFDLQFMEYNPPSIKELTTIQPSLSYLVSRAASQGVRYRLAATGAWNFISLASPFFVKYDQVGNLWYGSSTTVTNRTGTTTQAINSVGGKLCMASDVNNNVFVGGDFTTPQNYIMVYNGSTWAVPFISSGFAINGAVRAMTFGVDGALYLAGDFTQPGIGITKYVYGPLGSVGNYVSIHSGFLISTPRAMVTGLDGMIYICGNNGIVKYNPTTSIYTDITGSINGVIRTLAVLPDGRIVAGGAWLYSGYPYIAVYNGTNWQTLGSGLNGEVATLSVNKNTGDLYAIGSFTASGSALLPGGAARYNGSNWLPMDIANTLPTSNTTNTSDIRNSDGEIAMSSTHTATQTLTNGASNAVVYAGTADVFPVVKFTGPGTLISLTNVTTGKSLYFNNYTLLAGETATFTHDAAGGISFVSSFFNNVLGRILPGSDKTQFSLVPGTNYIEPYITGSSGATKCELIYQNTHFSLEAGAL